MWKKYLLTIDDFILIKQDKNETFKLVINKKVKEFSGDHIFIVANKKFHFIYCDLTTKMENIVIDQTDDIDVANEWLKRLHEKEKVAGEEFEKIKARCVK